MTPDTLASRLGTTTHLSPLLMKARRLGLVVPEDLERLAVRRGLWYYELRGESAKLLGDPRLDVGRDEFSDAELAVALLSAHLPKALIRQRLGAAMLGAVGVDAAEVARLAALEGCEAIIRQIADCGEAVEAENPFWQALQDALGPVHYDPNEMPHPTRYIEMTGITRGKVGVLKSWVRPVAAPIGGGRF